MTWYVFRKRNLYVSTEIRLVILVINTVNVLSLSPIQYFVLEFGVNLNDQVLFYVNLTYDQQICYRKLCNKNV